MDQLDLIDIYRTFHPKTMNFTFFSSVQRTFSRIVHNLSHKSRLQFSSVQLHSHVQLFVTPWTSACQSFLSITSSRSLLKLKSIELVIPSNHLILCLLFSSCLQSFPSSESFQMRQFFASGGQSVGVSASTSVLPVNIQD